MTEHLRTTSGTDPGPADPVPTVLGTEQWWSLQAAHQERVDALTHAHRARAKGQIPHPVEDFLFTYYSQRPAQLRRWYPGAGVALEDAADRLDWRFHRELPPHGQSGSPPAGPLVTVDLAAFRQARGSQLTFTGRLLRATAAAPGQGLLRAL